MKRTLAFLAALILALAPAIQLAPIAQATVATTTNKTIVNGDGVTTNFTFAFAVRSAADLSVLYTDASGNVTTLSPTLYTVTLNPVPAGQLWATGGTVTYPKSGSAIASGTTLTILRSVGLLQTTSLINQGGYYPSSVEQALDLGAMQAQQLNEVAGRSIAAPSTDSGITMTLPAAAARANSALCFDSSGNAALCSKSTSAVISSPAPTVVTNAAALKAMSGMVNGFVAQTAGYYANGDGGQAVYWWNASDTTADNGGTVLALNAGGTGRWNLIHQGLVNIKQFGAKVDGATIDTAAWAAAIAAAPGKFTIYMPAGTSMAVVSVRANNAAIFGAGSALSTIRHPTGVALSNVLELGNTALGNSAPAYSGIVVRGLTLDCNRANIAQGSDDVTGHGLPMTNVSNSNITDLRAINCWNAGVGVFINSNYNTLDVYSDTSGTSAGTGTGPCFDINSSNYNVVRFVSKSCYDGGRILDNSVGNVVQGTIFSPTHAGFIMQNQTQNESYGNVVDVAVNCGSCTSNGVSLGVGFRNNRITAAVRNAGDVGLNITNFSITVKTFDGSSGAVVNTTNNTITIATHGLLTGARVIYSSGGGTPITGLTDGGVYYIIAVDTNTIALASSQANASAGTRVALTGVGAGASHSVTFNPRSIGNVINISTQLSANQGTVVGGDSNTININSWLDGRAGAQGANFAVDVTGNRNVLTVTHSDSSPWHVRGIAMRSGATGNVVAGYQWDNTADPFNDAGTSTVGPNGRPYNAAAFEPSFVGGFTLTRTAPTYGASVAIDASQGNLFDISVTDGNAFTIANPTNAIDGKRITITVRNASGGVLGAVTWGNLYKLATWTSPANSNSRSIDFKYNGTNWIEIGRTTADVPN